MFEACDLNCHVIIADSRQTALEDLSPVETWRSGVSFRPFQPGVTVFDKLADVLPSIKTPYVLVTPDRKIDLPYAVKAALDHLRHNGDCAAALGYVIGFEKRDHDIDINRVFSSRRPLGRTIRCSATTTSCGVISPRSGPRSGARP